MDILTRNLIKKFQVYLNKSAEEVRKEKTINVTVNKVMASNFTAPEVTQIKVENKHTATEKNCTGLEKKKMLDAEINECIDELAILTNGLEKDEKVKAIMEQAYTIDGSDAIQKAMPYYDDPTTSYPLFVKKLNTALIKLARPKFKPVTYIPSSEQLRVLYSKARRKLIEAGPGAGKTATIINEQFLAQVIFKLDAKDILSITYTKAGILSMEQKYEFLNKEFYTSAGTAGKSLSFSTIHSYCLDLIKLIDRTKGNSILIQGQTLHLRYEYTGGNGYWDEETEEFIEEEPDNVDDEGYINIYLSIDEMIQDACKSIGISKLPATPGSIFSAISVILEFQIENDEEFRIIEQYSDFPLTYDQLCAINAKYKSLKAEWDVMDFNDMLVWVNNFLQELLEKIKTEGKAKALYDLHNERLVDRIVFKAIYVDEFQDISPLQMSIIKSLLDITPETMLTAIGDSDQSIFSFKGADVKYMLGFPLEYRDDQLDVIYMTVNRRSVPVIVEVSKNLIQNNKSRFNKQVTYLPAKEDERGSVSLRRDFNQRVSYGIITKRTTDIINKMEGKSGKIAVLYREHTQAERLYSFMIQNKYMFYTRLTSSSPYLVPNNPVFQDFVKIMNIVYAPNDIGYIENAIYFLAKDISKADAEDIRLELLKDRNKRLSDVLKSKEAWKPAITNLNNLIKISKKPDLTCYEFFLIVARIYKECYFDEYAAKAKKTEWLKSSVGLVLDYLKSYGPLTNFQKKRSEDIAWIKCRNNITNRAGVNFVTMHGSKGEEWDEVYILPLSDTVTPKMQQVEKMTSKGKKAYIEEERRLLYVAITRAKRELTIFYETDQEDYDGYFATELKEAISNVPEKFRDQTIIN